MGRRFILSIGTALAVGLGTTSAWAWQDSQASSSESRNPLPPAIERGSEDDASPKTKTSTKKRVVKKTTSSESWLGKTVAGDDPPRAGKLKTELLPGEGTAPPIPAEPAALDPEVAQAQSPSTKAPTPADSGAMLPPAVDAAGKPTGPVSGIDESDSNFLPRPERLPIGSQTIGLTVQVISPQTLNLNKPATLKILVRNTGPTEALGVVVRDVLPDGVSYVGSQPEATRTEAILTWKLGAVASGAERAILVNVTPTKPGAFDHSATVSMMAGSRATTLVREPKLKVEQTASASQVLKGQPVEFRIAVTNKGDGPARGVTVQAKLSPGLRAESGEANDQNLFEQTLKVINPGDRIELDTLVADTTLGGEQTSVVIVQSPDVVAGSPDAKSVKTVQVVEPKVVLTMSGSDKRYTGTSASYEIKLKNTGTAPARNLKVVSTLPTSARLVSKSAAGATFNSQTRKLIWTKPILEPGGEETLSFQVGLGGPGLYQFTAEARGDGAIFEKNTMTTDVLAVADIRLEVSESRRVIDVGETTILKIMISNKGTKAATKIAVHATLAETIKATEIAGTADGGKFDLKTRQCLFPLIERLDPGKEMMLQIRVEAVKPGTADCRVFLTHGGSTDEKLDETLDDFAVFKVTQRAK